MMEERRELTPEEIRTTNVDVGLIQVNAVITIRDKDGNVKGKIPMSTSAVNQETKEDAT